MVDGLVFYKVLELTERGTDGGFCQLGDFTKTILQNVNLRFDGVDLLGKVGEVGQGCGEYVEIVSKFCLLTLNFKILKHDSLCLQKNQKNF